MSTTFSHRHGHAVVAFSDELTWASALDLVGCIDSVVDAYFYACVELIVSSPGGACPALDYVLEVLALRRAQGVRFRTRIISRASSAAAVLACLGDERVAEAGARLLFHRSRAVNVEEITAHEMSELHTVLTHTDERWLSLMAERALEGAKRPCPDFERSDRAVLEHLWTALHDARGSKAPPRTLRDLGRAVSGAVERAARAGDRDLFVRLYRQLSDAELSISARVALALRLVDRVGAPAPAPGGGGRAGDGLTVPEWRVLYPPHGAVPRAALTRHMLVLGETGSGKTASAILPVAAAMARTPLERLGAALVIDPKRELAPALERIAPERVERLEMSALALNLMVGPRWSLEDTLAEGRWLSAAGRILARLVSFVPSSPARVLGAHEGSASGHEFFDREGSELLLCVLAVVLMVTHGHAPAPEQWLAGDDHARAWVEALMARARGTEHQRGPNVLALAAWALDTGLPPRRDGSAGEDLTVRYESAARVVAPRRPRLSRVLDAKGQAIEWPQEAEEAAVAAALELEDEAEPPPAPPPSRWLFARVAHAARAVWGAAPGEGRDVLERIVGYWADQAGITSQYAGVRTTARVACSELAQPALARTLYFGCEPGFAQAKAAGAVRCDFAAAVSPRAPTGRLWLFQPARDGLDTLVAMALKALFFEAVLGDPDRARGGADLPLVGYVVDEAQLFLSSDRVHGDQSFLDVSRASGALCLLACQSMSSLEHALSHGAGSARRNASALSMLWTNTGTKLVFRSTDPQTAERVGALCPYQPGLAGVTRVRPVSTLAPGECYAVLADGRFERRQLDAFEGAPAPARARERARAPEPARARPPRRRTGQRRDRAARTV